MNWPMLISFIEEQAPGFSESTMGATEEEIQAIASLHPVPLPKEYVSFLEVMGHHQGEFFLGRHVYSSVVEILKDPQTRLACDDAPSYPDRRFLWIGGSTDIDNDDYPGEIYLDLLGPSKEDPPVVLCDFYQGYSDTYQPFVLAKTFCEHIQKRAFEDLVRRRRAFAFRLYLAPENDDVPALAVHTLRLLDQLGYSEVLSGGDHLKVLSGGDDIVMRAELADFSLRLSIVGNNQDRILTLVEHIRDGIPGEHSGDWSDW